jgi:hypothetical protein
MIDDVLCIESIFDDPQEIINLAKKQRYYFCEDNPTLKNTNINYSGERTDHLANILSDDEYYELTKKIISKIFKNVPSSNIKAQIVCLFHYLTEMDIPNNSWMHKDTSLYSGVIYLSEGFNDKYNNHGTKIIIGRDVVNYQNKFNRLVLYRGDYLHSANFGFGQNMDNSRLTLNFFINEITIDMNNENNVKEKYYDYKT